MCIGGTSQWPATIFRGIGPVGREVRLPARGPDRRRDRRVLHRRRHFERRAVAHADLPAAERRAQRAVLPAARPLPQGGGRLRRRGPLARRALGRDLLHPAPHAGDHARHALVRECDPDLDRHDGRLPGDGERVQVQARHRHPGAPRPARDDRRLRRGAGHPRRAAAPAGELPAAPAGRLFRHLDRRRRLRRPARARSRARSQGRGREPRGVARGGTRDLRRRRHRGREARQRGHAAPARRAARRPPAQGRRGAHAHRQGDRADHRQPGRAQGERQPAHLLREVRRRPRAGARELQGPRRPRRRRDRGVEPQRRRLEALHRRAAGVPAVLLPGLRRPPRERDRARGRPRRCATSSCT